MGADWGDEPVFLYAGDAEFSNGAQVFLDAAAELVKRRPKALFLLACRAKTPRSVTALRDLEHRARRLGVLDRTRFLGTVPDMPSLLGAVDAVVMPVNTLYAKVDTPYVLLEAMARQTPVIVSDLPALTELAGLGEGITVVKRDDSSAVAVAMAEVVSSASHRQWLGTLARRTVQANFSSDTMIDAYETLYSELFHGS